MNISFSSPCFCVRIPGMWRVSNRDEAQRQFSIPVLGSSGRRSTPRLTWLRLRNGPTQPPPASRSGISSIPLLWVSAKSGRLHHCEVLPILQYISSANVKDIFDLKSFKRPNLVSKYTFRSAKKCFSCTVGAEPRSLSNLVGRHGYAPR